MPTNVIQNPSFASGSLDWTTYGGVVIGSGHATANNATQILTQNVPLTVGTVYSFSFDINMTGGAQLRVTNGITNGSNTVWTSPNLSNGPQTLNGTFTAVDTFFSVEASAATFSGTLTNFNVFVQPQSVQVAGLSIIGVTTPSLANARIAQLSVMGVTAPTPANVQISQLAIIGVLNGPPFSLSLGPAFKLPCWQPCTAFGTEAIVVVFK